MTQILVSALLWLLVSGEQDVEPVETLLGRNQRRRALDGVELGRGQLVGLLDPKRVEGAQPGPEPVVGLDALLEGRLRNAQVEGALEAPGQPAELEPQGTGTLWERLGRDGWRNFYRRGDPLGWRVFSDDESAYDIRVPEVPRPEAGDPGPKVGTHSGYQHSLEYRRVVGDWLGERLVEDEHWTIGEVQPLPEP